MGNDQNGPWTKTAHSPGPKRPTLMSKTARSYIQNGPWGCTKWPTAGSKTAHRIFTFCFSCDLFVIIALIF